MPRFRWGIYRKECGEFIIFYASHTFCDKGNSFYGNNLQCNVFIYEEKIN